MTEEGPITQGADLIKAERQRQIEQEGWTPEHDADEHENGELVNAARAYLMAALVANGGDAASLSAPLNMWPWEPSWWKPSADSVRNLVKAGALIAAEIDRLQRADG